MALPEQYTDEEAIKKHANRLDNKDFIGKEYPTFFEGRNTNEDGVMHYNYYLDSRCRLVFRTDAVNDYLTRENDPAEYAVLFDGCSFSTVVNLLNGQAMFTLDMHKHKFNVGDKLHLTVMVKDSRQEFVTTVEITVRSKRKKQQARPVKDGGCDPGPLPVKAPEPDIFLLTRKEWKDRDFPSNLFAQVLRGDDNPSVYLLNHDALGKYLDDIGIEKELGEELYKCVMGMFAHVQLSEFEKSAQQENSKIKEEDVEFLVSEIVHNFAQPALPLTQYAGEVIAIATDDKPHRKAPQARMPRSKTAVKPERRIRRGQRTPESEFKQPLNEILEKYGSLSRRDFIRAMDKDYIQTGKLKLNPVDFEKLRSGQIRWHSTVSFLRGNLVRSGSMSDKDRGTWALEQQTQE